MASRPRGCAKPVAMVGRSTVDVCDAPSRDKYGCGAAAGGWSAVAEQAPQQCHRRLGSGGRGRGDCRIYGATGRRFRRRSSPVSSSTSAATSTPVTTSKAPETLRPSRNSLNSGIAEVACENAVKDRLKSPSTADFPDNNTRKNADGSFQVRGVVDSDNSFGATTRSYFGCTVIPAGIGQHRVTVDELFQP